MNRVEFLLNAVKGRVLDVGFNPLDSELHEKIVKKAGQENVIGIDVIVKKFESSIVRASAEQMPFKNECFDSIIAGELIEHLHKPEKFIQECSRVLEKNGLLALSTPNKKSWVNRLFHSYKAPLHYSLFSIDELIKLLEKNSLKIISLKMFPYTLESSEGTKHQWFMPFRKILHSLMPNPLKENIGLIAQKS